MKWGGSVEDKPSFEEVYEQYQPLCRNQAHRYARIFNRTHDLDDLLQEARIGLWEAYRTSKAWQAFPLWAKRKVAYTLHTFCTTDHLIRVPPTNRRTGHKHAPMGAVPVDDLRSMAGDVGADARVIRAEEDSGASERVGIAIASLPDMEYQAVCLRAMGVPARGAAYRQLGLGATQLAQVLQLAHKRIQVRLRGVS